MKSRFLATRGMIFQENRTTRNPSCMAGILRFAQNDKRRLAAANGKQISRPDGQLNFAAAALHAFERLRQFVQGNFFADEILAKNVAATDSLESFANEARRVVERRNQLDLGIVYGRGVDGNVRAGGQAAEEIHDT